MMNETSIIGTFFKPRQKAIACYATHTEAIQEKVLARLVEKAKATEWGRKYDYRTIKSYQDFQQRVPVQTYEEIKEYVDRMRHGEKNILWPGEVGWYAKSSGTTNDKSKFIPVYSEFINKPRGGLFGCQGDEWINWCTAEEFRTDYYKYCVEYELTTAEIKLIHTPEDFLFLIKIFNSSITFSFKLSLKAAFSNSGINLPRIL